MSGVGLRLIIDSLVRKTSDGSSLCFLSYLFGLLFFVFEITIVSTMAISIAISILSETPVPNAIEYDSNVFQGVYQKVRIQYFDRGFRGNSMPNHI